MRTTKTKVDDAARAAAQVVPTGLPDGEVPPHEDEVDAVPEEASRRRDADETSQFAGVVHDIRQVDVPATYERLRDELRLGDGVVHYAQVLAAADSAERNAFDAGLLARAAKLEQEEVDRRTGAELEVLRTAARDELEKEKTEGRRSKAPTIQDVEDRVVANWPDKSSQLHRRREEIHAARAVADNLESRWVSRCATLRSMLDRYAPRRDPG